MYKTVYDLTPDQLEELKLVYCWDESTAHIPKFDHLGKPVLFSGDIPDSVIFDYYAGTSFIDDDFCCTADCCEICSDCNIPTYKRLYDID